MAIVTFTITSPSDDAKFRERQLIGQGLETLGWVRCGDTGQINWATVTRPAGGTSAGYEIFRMNDALQATAPVFMRLDHASGSSTSLPSLWAAIGTATDGSGNLVDTTTIAKLTTSTSGTAYPCIMSGDNSRFTLSCGPTWNALLSIERSQSDAGANTGDVVALTAFSTTQINPGYRTIRYTPSVAVPPITAKLQVAVPDGSSWQNGADVGLSPVFHLGRSILNPSKDLLCYLTDDIVEGNIVPISVYGTSHDYYALGSRHTSAFTNPSGRILMRWE